MNRNAPKVRSSKCKEKVDQTLWLKIDVNLIYNPRMQSQVD